MSERKLTVLQLLPSLESGGVERGTLEIANELVRRGHRSLVISSGGRMVEALERAGSEHITWDIGAKSPLTLRFVPRLRRLLAERHIDIVHARSRMPAWIAYLAWRGMNPATRPHFVTTVHGLYSVNRYSAVMTRGERIIAVSNTARDYLLNNYPQVEASRIVVIPRGVDPQEFPYGYRPVYGMAGGVVCAIPAAQGQVRHHPAGAVDAAQRARGLHNPHGANSRPRDWRCTA